jgi:hypothetical protein
MRCYEIGVAPKLETLKIETHCSEQRFRWQVPELSRRISDCNSAADSERGEYVCAK